MIADLSVDRHSTESGYWWAGVACGVAAFASVLYALVAKRRPARTTTSQVVSTEGEDDDRATGHKIIAFPRKAVPGPDAASALEEAYDYIWDALEGLWTFHDLHKGLASQVSERQFALAQSSLADAARCVGELLDQAERAMEPAQDSDV